MKYKYEQWQNLDPSEKEKYRKLENERLHKNRREFIEKYLSAEEFEEKYDSDFDKVSKKVAELFKSECPQCFCQTL